MSQLMIIWSGDRSNSQDMGKDSSQQLDTLTLNYCINFLACTFQPSNPAKSNFVISGLTNVPVYGK